MTGTGEERDVGVEGETRGIRPGGQERKRRLAVLVLETCRNQLFFRYRYMEQALFRLNWAENSRIFFGSDGEYMYYNYKYILNRYMENPVQMTFDYLHTVMHCLYQHPFLCPGKGSGEEGEYWDLAADLAVEWVLEEMAQEVGEERGTSQNPAREPGDRGRLPREILFQLKEEIGVLSAQKIYAWLQENVLSGWTFAGLTFRELSALFRRDNHEMWRQKGGSRAQQSKTEEKGGQGQDWEGIQQNHIEGKDGQGQDREGTQQNHIEGKDGQGQDWEGIRQNHIEGKDGQGQEPEGSQRNNTEGDGQSQVWEKSGSRGRQLWQVWKATAAQVLMEAQAFSKKERGEAAGSMIRSLKKLTRETCDYSEFLSKFAAHLEERMQVDQEEFDYVYYTYGLRLLGRVPLIEPLEYKEKYLIREFVIAIDTSGSCQGELVERFLSKTYHILQQAGSFTSKVNIHILQCDAEIQEDARIGSREELEDYIHNLMLKGFGGTDFTPVFEYTDQLLEKGEIKKLDGLLYFTDGYGRFPAKPPRYRTAFVFLDKEEDVKVPAWAMKVYLDKEDLG